MNSWKLTFGSALFLGLSACSDAEPQETGGTPQDTDTGTECATGAPGELDLCDGVDNDCDGEVDEDPATQTWYIDADADGYGESAAQIAACEVPEGYSEVDGDCDDDDTAVLPGASEVCDSADNDCDGLVDDADPSVTGQSPWYEDADGDGAGAGPTFLFCEQPEGFVETDEDCNDEDGDIIDPSDWYVDEDGDGYGDADHATLSTCELPEGYAPVAGDCDDGEPARNPGETETCLDGIDNDCDGTDNGCNPLEGSISAVAADATLTVSSSYFGMYLDQSDLDADGVPELLTSSPYGGDGYGAAYAFEGLDVGSTGGASLASTTVSGSSSYPYFGYDISSPGDLSGDGYDDLIAVTSGADVVLIDGPFSSSDSADRATTVLSGLVSGSDITHRRLDGSEQMLVIGDRYSSNYGSYAGAAYLVASPLPEGGYSIEDIYEGVFYSETSNAYLGTEVAMLGDIDGDGTDEVGVGAPYYSGFYTYGGAVIVDASDSTGKIAADDAAYGVTGETTYRYVGWTVAGPGDTDGDGYDDLLVSARADDTLTGSDTGAAYLFLGPLDIGLSGTSAATATLYSTETTSGYFGQHVAGAGDLDADGQMDLLVTDYGNSSGGERAGAAFLFYSPLSGTYASADATVYGNASAYVGVAGQGVGDLNSDGYDDLAISVYGDNALILFFGGSL